MNRLAIIKRIANLHGSKCPDSHHYNDMIGAMARMKADADYELLIVNGNPDLVLKEQYADKGIAAQIVYKGNCRYKFPFFYNGGIIVIQIFSRPKKLKTV